MDPVTLAYYTLICAGLAFVAPRLGRPMRRLGIGMLVGLVAAMALPLLRGLFSF